MSQIVLESLEMIMDAKCCQKLSKLLLQVMGTGSLWGGTEFPVLNWQNWGFLHSGTGSCIGRNRVPIQKPGSSFLKLSGTGSCIGRNRVPCVFFQNFQNFKNSYFLNRNSDSSAVFGVIS